LPPALTGIAQCNRPTAFAVPPLPAGHDRAYCPDLGSCARSFRSNPRSSNLHARIRIAILIPARYSCRFPSSVWHPGTEKRSRFHRPSFLHSAVARIALSRNEPFTALADLRDTTRPCLRAPMGDAANAPAAELAWLVLWPRHRRSETEAFLILSVERLPDLS
jgi:hypothetical protein